MAKRTVAIALFRNDLRLHDNAVLHHVHHSAEPKPTHVLPLFVFDERQVELSGLPGYKRTGEEARTPVCKLWRTGPFRLRFIVESVYDLQRSLRARGSDLLIRFGIVEQVAAALVEELQDQGARVAGIYIQKEATTEEVQTERRLEKLLKPLDVHVTYLHSKPLVHPDDLPFSVDKMPDVFTPFRKRIEGLERVARPAVPVPSPMLPFPTSPSPSPPGMYGSGLDSVDAQGLLNHLLKPLGVPSSEGLQTDKRSAFPYRGGEQEALRRLDDYFARGSPPPVSKYKTTRNQLLGEGYSTKMSPFLAFGCLSPRTMLEALEQHERKFGATKDTYWVFFEMLWRDFFLYTSEKFGYRLFTLAGFEEVTDPKAAERKVDGWKQLPPEGSKRSENDFALAWMRGRTGIPFLDANMMELQESGFMSNRGRQNVASFLSKDLYYDWRIGAEFFEANLLDYDVAANYGNWQYVAGVGNDPRASRQFNPIKQGKDYDPLGEYVKTWLPQLEKVPSYRIHTPWLLSDREWTAYGCGDYPRQPILEQGSWKPHYDRGTAPKEPSFSNKRKQEGGGGSDRGRGRGGGWSGGRGRGKPRGH